MHRERTEYRKHLPPSFHLNSKLNQVAMAYSHPPGLIHDFAGAIIILFFIFSVPFTAAADDVKSDDERAPKSDSCNNPFQLVILQIWQLFQSF